MDTKERQRHLMNVVLTAIMALLFSNLMLLLATKRMEEELEELYIRPLQSK